MNSINTLNNINYIILNQVYEILSYQLKHVLNATFEIDIEYFDAIMKHLLKLRQGRKREREREEKLVIKAKATHS